MVTHHKNGSTNWTGFDEIIKAHPANLLIVGLPFDQDGKEQEWPLLLSLLPENSKLATVSKQRWLMNIYLHLIAKNQLKYNHYHPNAERGEVDKRSAQLILQTWLNEKRFD